jgi:ribose transport system ATP-binding protein
MIIETKGLSKRFGTFYALKDIDFQLREGEIHGLVGENGAGKSTFIKILTGVYHRSDGDIYVAGEKVSIDSPSQSRALGISVIHQDRNLIPAFDCIENVYLGMNMPKKHLTSVDYKTMQQRIESVMAKYDIELPLETLARDLTPPQKTMLEIIRAVMTKCKVLILDEPTASLTDKETALLFSLIRKLHADGTAILYISHRLEEIFELTDTITVFKNGQLVQTVATKDIDSSGLIRLMTDNWTSKVERHGEAPKGKSLYSVEHLVSADGVVKDASFEAHSHEIMGIFGLGGSGRTETLEACYGYKRKLSGTVSLEGKELKDPTPSRSIKEGIVLIHEDRRGHSLVMTRKVRDNIVLSTIDSYVHHGFYQAQKELNDSKAKIEELDIKTTGPDQPVLELSGGNQQKVVFAKALISSPKVFLCDEPTQAVDVMTRQEIHDLLRKCADAGSAVVFVTSDLKEMLEVADSIVIMANGRTWERLENKGLTAEQVLGYCYKAR